MTLPGQLFDLDGTTVFAHRSGSGPALILLHGFLVSHWYFRDVIGPLAERFCVIAVDLPGFGESDRPPPSRYPYGLPAYARTVLALCDRLEIARVGLLGHSMGGQVALAVAAAAPERVAALVLEATPASPLAAPFWARLGLVPGLGELLFERTLGKAQLAHALRTYGYGAPHFVPDEAVDFWWSRLCRPGGKEAAHAVFRALFGPGAGLTSPPMVAAPVLCVWGERDPLVPLEDGRRLAAMLGAPLRVVPATGHTPHEERPRAFLQIVAPFLEASLARAPAAAQTVPPRRRSGPGG